MDEGDKSVGFVVFLLCSCHYFRYVIRLETEGLLLVVVFPVMLWAIVVQRARLWQLEVCGAHLMRRAS